MKKHYLLGACMFAAMLTACTDEEQSLSGVHEGILTATVESNSVSSRVGFTTSNGKFYWSKGDRLGVTTSQSNTLFTPLNIGESGIGQASASFSGKVSGTVEGYAVYPHNDTHAMNGTTLTYQFPSEYTYETLDADFTTATQGHGNSFNPPMWGEINNGSVALKHLGGVFCIKIDKLPVGNDLKMTLTSDKKLNGSYTVNLAASDNTPAITVTETSVETEKTVSVHFTNAETDATGVFYVPAPVGTHILRLKVWSGTSEKLNTALGTVTIARKALKVFSLSDGVLNAGAATEVNNVSNVGSTLSNSNSVLLTAAVQGSDNTVTIPTVTSGTSNPSKTVAFSQINNGASLSIEDANASGSANQSVSNLSVVLPSNESAEGDGGSGSGSNDKPNLNINMPNTTVVLETSGSFEANEVTASTADNTLVVGRGMVINTLNVKQGNVKVKRGAQIKQIKLSVNGKTIIFYVEDIDNFTKDFPENVKVVSMGVSELEKVAAEGGTYQLNEDLTLARPIVVNDKDVTIDLNGHKLTAGVFADNDDVISTGTSDSYVFRVKGGKLTVNGEGTVAAQAATYSMAVYASGNGEVVINGGTYTNEGDNGSDLIYAKGNARITINGGTFKATAKGSGEDATRNKRSALNLKDADKETASITVKGGKFYEFNPAYNLSEGEGTNYVADGYSSVLSNDKYYVVSQGAAAVQPWDGTSMQEPMMVNGVYTVETPAQWAWLTQHNTQGADIKLLNDLDFGNKEIGAMMLLGNFDGNNKIMSNITVSINKTLNGTQGQTAIGLFKDVAKSVTAKNLTIKNIKIDNNLSTHYTGSLLGEANFNPNVVLTIDGVTVENADLKGVNGVGGLVGMVGVGKEVRVSNVAVKNSTLQNYSVEKESGFVGGLVGRVQNPLVIDKNVTLSDNKIVGYYAGEKENRPESCIDAVAAIRKGTTGKITGNATVNGGTVVAYPVGAILIGNVSELLAFAVEANKKTTGQPYQNQTVILTADIDLNGAEWKPLCNSGGADFYGTFDGNGKTISNFKVNHCNSSNSAEGAGFIGWLGSTGTVKDLTIDKAQIKGSHNVGGIVGYIQGGKVENCTVKNSIISCLFNTILSDDGDKCGGIAGYLHNTSITGCSVVDTTIDAVRDAGQILGCKAGGTVDDKTNTATNVTVTYNKSDEGKADKSNTNIEDKLVGRTL